MTLAIVSMTVTDPEALAAYREKAGEALAKHGARIVGAGPDPVLIEGSKSPDAVAVIEFPSPEAVQAWRNDPELAETHALRGKIGETTIVVVPGT